MSKHSNSIIVGGPIAVGKSTLVGALPFIPVQELDPNDELQRLLLEKMYEGDQIASQVFQLDILLTRFDKYKKLANEENTHIFDRSIFEDVFFAKKILGQYPNVWNYYHSIWKDKVEELINVIGIPKLYIFLSCNWDEFKQRIFERNRKSEIQNFKKNELYFKNMIEGYPQFMKDTFDKFDIPHLIVDTNGMNKLEIVTLVKKELSKIGFL